MGCLRRASGTLRQMGRFACSGGAPRREECFTVYREGETFDCIRKMNWEKWCSDASLATRMAIEPCRHVLALRTGVFSCWEQTQVALLPPLRVVPASGLPEAATRGEVPKRRLQCLSFLHIIRLTGRWCCREIRVYGHQGEAQREADALYCPSAMRSGD